MPYYNRDPKRDPNFDNHPYKSFDLEDRACAVEDPSLAQGSCLYYEPQILDQIITPVVCRRELPAIVLYGLD